MPFKSLLLSSCVLMLGASPALAEGTGASVQSKTETASGKDRLKSFVSDISIPYSTFKLANGLTVIVHTDRTAPEVAVSVWYNVGSKHEPKGRSGFAHLFEHLMFNGTENVPGDYFKPLQEAGATNLNGTTSNDRTNYYETVPVSALDRALFMESDRMGHLLGAVGQATLDEQRGVVQNEKRNGDDSPYSVIGDRVTETLYPADHPYGHSVIGSMADLDAADLADVRGWFRQHYGPNNALLVLAGDIDIAKAKPLVEKYFGDIQSGPANVRPSAPVPTLKARVDEQITSPVTTPTIVRAWAVPGYDNTDSLALDAMSGVMGGQIDDAYLKQVLVRERKLFETISVGNMTLAQGGTFQIRGRVAKGVDPALAAKELDATIAEFLAKPVSADQLLRWTTKFLVGYAQGQEGLQGRAETLATGMIYTDDANAYRRDLNYWTSLTPEKAQAIARKWLGRPVYALTVNVGPRTPDRTPDDTAVAGAAPAVEAALPPRRTRMPMPGMGQPAGTRFPAIEHAKLSNGIELLYSRKATLPFTQMSLVFPAGSQVDAPDRHGLQSLMFSTMDKGLPGRSSASIEAEKERLGATISYGASVDESSTWLSTPSVSLTPALKLFGSMLKEPTFPEVEVDRTRRETLAMLDQRRINPDALIQQVLPKLIDANSPYAIHSGLGDPEAIAKIQISELVEAHKKWVRPEGAKLFIVSDLSLAALKPLLEAQLGAWRVAGTPTAIPVRAAPAPASPQIVLIDRDGSAQASISGGQIVQLADREDLTPLLMANRALGNGFLARINMNLREDKHWSYGASGDFLDRRQEQTYTVDTSVQQDKAGPAFSELRKEVTDFITKRPMTQAELDFTRGSALRSMSSWFGSAGAVLSGMQENDRHGRPDDYYNHLGEEYQSYTLDQLNSGMRNALKPQSWVWAVVGDAKIVRPQLEGLNLPVKVINADDVFKKKDLNPAKP